MSTPADEPSTPWLVMRVLCLASLCLASPLSAQNGDPSDDASVRVFTGYRFHLNAVALLDDDERFNWDADYGGDIDVVDFGVGRFIFLANFEAILGEQFRRFDVNQGNYILDGTVTYRLGSTEIGGTFHHISRGTVRSAGGTRPKYCVTSSSAAEDSKSPTTTRVALLGT